MSSSYKCAPGFNGLVMRAATRLRGHAIERPSCQRYGGRASVGLHGTRNRPQRTRTSTWRPILRSLRHRLARHGPAHDRIDGLRACARMTRPRSSRSPPEHRPMDPANLAPLRRLFDEQRVAALATLHRGEPAVSMTPFALPSGESSLLVHVSAL